MEGSAPNCTESGLRLGPGRRQGYPLPSFPLPEKENSRRPQQEPCLYFRTRSAAWWPECAPSRAGGGKCPSCASRRGEVVQTTGGRAACASVRRAEEPEGSGAHRLRMCFRKAARDGVRASEADPRVAPPATPRTPRAPVCPCPLTLVVDAAVAVLVASQDSLHFLLGHLLSWTPSTVRAPGPATPPHPALSFPCGPRPRRLGTGERSDRQEASCRG